MSRKILANGLVVAALLGAISYTLSNIDMTVKIPDYKAECFAKGGFEFKQETNSRIGQCIFRNPNNN